MRVLREGAAHRIRDPIVEAGCNDHTIGRGHHSGEYHQDGGRWDYLQFRRSRYRRCRTFLKWLLRLSMQPGFDVFGALLARHAVATFGYCFLAFIISYFFLKSREIAA